mmetsp:Transcript_13256/g.18967  ORF Transcript_13256/g.18967 Transcript_13256/m.18967 type:complete len:86 (+) Transcript_13256:101-358(+)
MLEATADVLLSAWIQVQEESQKVCIEVGDDNENITMNQMFHKIDGFKTHGSAGSKESLISALTSLDLLLESINVGVISILMQLID